MVRKFFELLWQMIMMASVGVAVGRAVNGQWAASCFCLVIAGIAAFWWRQFRALESD